MLYTAYRCRTCKSEFILLTEEVDEQLKKQRYIVCPYCSSQRINKQRAADSLKECMQERAYKRVNGALRQR